LENGIPIVPFMGDKKDTELIKLIKYLKHIHSKPNLRIYNDKIFQLRKILNSRIESFIKYYNIDVISESSADSSSCGSGCSHLDDHIKEEVKEFVANNVALAFQLTDKTKSTP
jgi:hypothetical protein